jgi:hypothetical protein
MWLWSVKVEFAGERCLVMIIQNLIFRRKKFGYYPQRPYLEVVFIGLDPFSLNCLTQYEKLSLFSGKNLVKDLLLFVPEERLICNSVRKVDRFATVLFQHRENKPNI